MPLLVGRVAFSASSDRSGGYGSSCTSSKCPYFCIAYRSASRRAMGRRKWRTADAPSCRTELSHAAEPEGISCANSSLTRGSVGGRVAAHLFEAVRLGAHEG